MAGARIRRHKPKVVCGHTKVGKKTRILECDMFQGTQPSRWSPWRDGLSSSLLVLWLTCREQFRLEIVEGWRTRAEPLYFAFGTCVHWILKRAYERASFDADLPTTKWLKAQVRKYEAAWKKEVTRPTAKQLEQQEMVYGLVEAVLPAYFRRWCGDWTGKYPVKSPVVAPKRWVMLENQWRADISLPPFCSKNDWALSEKLPITGTCDGIFESVRTNEWIFDTKCLSIINEDDILDTLEHSLQMMLYLWARWKLTKKAPRGCVMNIVRRPGQRRTQKDTSLKAFFIRVKEDVANEKRWDHYFKRYQLEITAAELNEWQNNFLYPVLQDFVAWWQGRTPHYYNPQNLVSKYGRCQMFFPITKKVFTGCYRQKEVTGYAQRLA